MEKFQSAAVSGHPRGIPVLPTSSSSPPSSRFTHRERGERMHPFLLPRRGPLFPAFVSTSSGLSHDLLSRVYDFRLHCLHCKGKFSRSAPTIGEQPRTSFTSCPSRNRGRSYSPLLPPSAAKKRKKKRQRRKEKRIRRFRYRAASQFFTSGEPLASNNSISS